MDQLTQDIIAQMNENTAEAGRADTSRHITRLLAKNSFLLGQLAILLIQKES